MVRIPGFELLGKAPLAACKAGPRAQDSEDLPVQRRLVRRVACGADAVGAIVAVITFRNLHVVAVDEAAQRSDIPGMLFRALDLVGVYVDAGNTRSVKAGQIAHRPPDAAPQVDHFHPRFQGQPIADKTLTPEQRRLEAFALASGREVK